MLSGSQTARRARQIMRIVPHAMMAAGHCRKLKSMKVHYLEIVSADVEQTCRAYGGADFSSPEPALGNARVRKLPDGGLLGVRAPMSESEQPVVRPYWLVNDIGAALDAAVHAGGEVAHPPLEIPGHGTFAIYILGGNQHGLWQL